MALLSIGQTGNLQFIGNNHGSIGIGSPNFSDTTDAPFFSPSQTIPWTIDVIGAGASSGILSTTVKTFTDPSHVVLNANAGTAITTANYAVGCNLHGSWSAAVFKAIPQQTINSGDCLVLGMNVDPAVTVSSITDSAGNAWAHTPPSGTNGIVNADYYQQIWWCLSAASAAAGTLTITVTFSATPDQNSIAFFLSSLTSTVRGTWSIHAFSSNNGASNTAVTSGTVNTTIPNVVLWAMTGVDASTSAVGGGFTQATQNMQGGAALGDLASDVAATQILTTTQSGIGFSATQAPAGIFLSSMAAFAFTPNIGFIPIDVEPRGRGRAPIFEESPIDVKATPATLANVGYVPVDVERRGKGRPPLVEDAPIARVRSASVGWISVDTDPRGRGRYPIPEDPVVDRLPTTSLLGVGWAPVEISPTQRPKPPIVSLAGSTQNFIVSDVAGYAGVELEPRGRSRPLIDTDLPARPTTQTSSPSAGWYPIDVEPRGRGRYPIGEDAPVDPTKPLLTTGWQPIDVNPRGRGRAAIEPEFPVDPTKPLATTGWVPVDVERPRRPNAPIVEDAPVEPIVRSVGWMTVDVASPSRAKTPLVEDLPQHPLTVLPSIGWAPVDGNPPQRAKTPILEDPAIESRIVPPTSSSGWMPADVDPRGRGRFPLLEEAPLEARQTGVSESVGWVPVEVVPPLKGRAALPEDPPLERLILRPSGWEPIDVEPRGRGRAPIPEETPLERAMLRPSGWEPIDVRPPLKGARPLIEDSPVDTRHVVVLPSAGWMPIEVDPRGKGRLPLVEDPPVEPVHLIVLPSIGWMPIEVERPKRGALLADVELPSGGPQPIVFPPVPPPTPPPSPTGAVLSSGPDARFDTWWAPVSALYAYAGRGESSAIDDDTAEPETEIDAEALALAARLEKRAAWGAGRRESIAEPEIAPAKAPPKAPERTAEPSSGIAEPRRRAAQTPPKAAAEPVGVPPKAATPPPDTPPKALGAPQAPTGPRPGGAWVLGLAAAGVGAWLWEQAHRESLARTPPGNRAAAPPNSTVTSKMVKCGSDRCKACRRGPSHGPYWYAYWEDANGKTRWKYLGKTKPKR